jgi:DNA-binding response OmpR family regulator
MLETSLTKTVLVVEDDRAIGTFLVAFLEIEQRRLPYLQKPFDLDELILLIQQLLEREKAPLKG